MEVQMQIVRTKDYGQGFIQDFCKGGGRGAGWGDKEKVIKVLGTS